MTEKILLDSGYSSLKGSYKGKWYKIPTSISFSTNTGVMIGASKHVYDFEGDLYSVGNNSVDENSFSTTDFKVKLKFEPLIIKHFRDVLGISDEEVPEIMLSLAIVDWDKKAELEARCREFTVNGKVIKNRIQVMPQGFGAYYDFVHNVNNGVHPSSLFMIEIGYNTINALYYKDGEVVRSKCKGYPNHGVSSIIKPFTTFMESTYSMAFSEQECIDIFMKGKFTFNGELQKVVSDHIEVLQRQFVKKLFNSILVSDRKLLSTSEVVTMAGGGVYYLEDTVFPPNVKKVQKPYEFSNVRGMLAASTGK